MSLEIASGDPEEKQMRKQTVQLYAVVLTAMPLPALAHVDSAPHVHAYVWAGLAVASAIAAIAWVTSRNNK